MLVECEKNLKFKKLWKDISFSVFDNDIICKFDWNENGGVCKSWE